MLYSYYDKKSIFYKKNPSSRQENVMKREKILLLFISCFQDEVYVL